MFDKQVFPLMKLWVMTALCFRCFSITSLATWIFSLQRRAASLYSSHVAQSCFHWAYNFLFWLNSKRRSLVNQAGLLPELLDIQHSGIPCCCVLWRQCLKNDQHWWIPVPSKAFSQGSLLTSSLSNPKSVLLIFRVEVLLALFLLSTEHLGALLGFPWF